jgi:SAM-dependent methyltransferase
MDINVPVSQTPTELCFIMNYFGSDKGDPESSKRHSYTRLYYPLFGSVRDRPLRVFELGLGTNNTNFPSNMGVDGKPGASLRGWKQFFPRAEIFGADIDSGILFQEDRIRTFYCDQGSPDAIRDLWGQDVLVAPFDIIIDDAYHVFDYNVTFFENSWHKLAPGGVYVVEDIMYYTLDSWREKIAQWEQQFPFFSFRLCVIPHPHNPDDNTLLLIQRTT